MAVGNTNPPNLNQDIKDKVIFVKEIKKQREHAPAGVLDTYMVYRADLG